jgi:hypothetical protein
MMTWRGLTFVLDAGTGACAAFSAAYFLGRLLSGDETGRPRLTALFVLVLVCLAAATEAVALIALAAQPEPDDALGSPGWSLVRASSFLASAALGAIVVRRVIGR